MARLPSRSNQSRCCGPRILTPARLAVKPVALLSCPTPQPMPRIALSASVATEAQDAACEIRKTAFRYAAPIPHQSFDWGFSPKI